MQGEGGDSPVSVSSAWDLHNAAGSGTGRLWCCIVATGVLSTTVINSTIKTHQVRQVRVQEVGAGT